MARKNGMAGDVLISGEYQVPKIIRPHFLDTCRARLAYGILKTNKRVFAFKIINFWIF